MIGLDDSAAELGVIPSGVSWLYQLIDEQRRLTGARFSVRVSAVELTGRDEALRDLLSDTAHQSSHSPAGLPSSSLESKFHATCFLVASSCRKCYEDVAVLRGNRACPRRCYEKTGHVEFGIFVRTLKIE